MRKAELLKAYYTRYGMYARVRRYLARNGLNF